jgi:alanyl-tRNA synthetase
MEWLHRISGLMRVSESDAVEQVEKLLAGQKALEKQMENLRSRLAQSAVSDVENRVRTCKNVKVVAARLDGMDRQQMRILADSLRNKLKSAVVVLASAEDSTISIVSAVTKDLTGKVHAGRLAGSVAQAVGGKGGGRPDMVEGGGKDVAALDPALESVYTAVESQL